MCMCYEEVDGSVLLLCGVFFCGVFMGGVVCMYFGVGCIALDDEGCLDGCSM